MLLHQRVRRSDAPDAAKSQASTRRGSKKGVQPKPKAEVAKPKEPSKAKKSALAFRELVAQRYQEQRLRAQQELSGRDAGVERAERSKSVTAALATTRARRGGADQNRRAPRVSVFAPSAQDTTNTRFARSRSTSPALSISLPPTANAGLNDFYDNYVDSGPVPSSPEVPSSSASMVGGEFDEDEDENSLAMARAARAAMDASSASSAPPPSAPGVVRPRTTDQDGLTYSHAAPAAVDADQRTRNKVQQYKRDNIPFPADTKSANLKKWTNTFTPSITAWAGAQGVGWDVDPRVLLEAVADIFQSVYPELGEMLEDQHTLDILASLGDSIIMNWRSSLGKHAFKVIETWWAETMAKMDNIPPVRPKTSATASAEEREADEEYTEQRSLTIAREKRKWAANLLGHDKESKKMYRWLYRSPDALDKSLKHGFGSPGCLRLLAHHLEKTRGMVDGLATENWDHPIDAAAFGAAAFERALELTIDPPSAEDLAKKKSLHFTSSTRYKRVKTFLSAANKVADERWPGIVKLAAATAAMTLPEKGAGSGRGNGDDDEEEDIDV